MKELEKTYNPADIEDRLYQKWLPDFPEAVSIPGRMNGSSIPGIPCML